MESKKYIPSKYSYFIRAFAFYIFGCVSPCSAQNRIAIDSLNILLNRAESDSSRSRILNYIAAEFYNTNQDTALILTQKAYEFATKNTTCTICMIECLKGRSFIENRRMNLDKALELLDSAETMTNTLGDEVMLSRIWAMKGGVYNRKRQYQIAYLWLKKAIDLHETKRLSGDPFSIYYNAYLVLNNLERKTEAFETLMKAYPGVLQGNSITNKILCLLGITFELQYQGRMEESNEYIDQLLRITQQIGDKFNEAKGWFYLSEISSTKKDYKVSIERLEKALKVFGDNKDIQWSGRLWSGYGRICALTGNTDIATKYCSKALEISQKHKLPALLIDSYMGLAKVAEWKNKPDSAEFYFSKVIEVIDSNSVALKGQFQCFSIMSEYYERNNKWEKALLFFKQMNELQDSMLKITHHLEYSAYTQGLQQEQDKYQQNLHLLSTEKDRLFLQSKNLIAENNLKIQSNELLSNRLAIENQALRMLELDGISSKLNLDLANSIAKLAQEEAASEAKSNQMNLSNLQLKNSRLLAIVLALSGILTSLVLFYQFKKRRKVELENLQKKFVKDLHDDLGAEISTIKLLSDRIKVGLEETEKGQQLEKLTNRASELIQKMSTLVWTLNVENDVLENFVGYLRKYCHEYLQETHQLNLHFPLPEYGKNISQKAILGIVRREVFLIIKEALHNISKHSQATDVSILVQEHNNVLEITITDNGIGIAETAPKGNGIKNMQARAENIKGSLSISSTPGKGVQLIVSVPITKVS